MEIRKNVPIAELTTMRLGGAADFVISVFDAEDVRAPYRFAQEHNLSTWVMGCGANTIGRDEGFHGVIILNKLSGIKVLEENEQRLIVQAGGGEKWDDLVKFVCEKNFSGVEAMSMIPSTVGAAPVQNIGAYGQDISQVIESLDAYDTREQKIVTIPKQDMGMAYRHTRFNFGEDAERFFILSITIKLTQKQMPMPFYNSLQAYIDQHHETDFSPKNIRRMICEIRSQKLPDPEKIASAGSFFKNIYLDRDGADEAERSGIPVWRDVNGGGKINAGWLIEQCGLKGKLINGFHVSEKAALVLINESAKSYTDLEAARSKIIATVKDRFGFTLEQEPVEIKN